MTTVTALALHQIHNGTIVPEPIRVFTRGACEPMDWLRRIHGVPAKVRMLKGQSGFEVTYPHSQDRYTYVLLSETSLRYYWEVRVRASRTRIAHGVSSPAEVAALAAGITGAGEYLKIPAARLSVFVTPEPTNRMRVEAPSQMDHVLQTQARARSKALLRVGGPHYEGPGDYKRLCVS